MTDRHDEELPPPPGSENIIKLTRPRLLTVLPSAFYEAEGFSWDAEPQQQRPRSNGSERAEKPLPKLEPIPYVEGEIIPPQEWLVEPWIPIPQVTLLQGDGGDGKSTLAQQLQASCATKLPWLGLSVQEYVSVGFYSEETKNELLRRQSFIDANYALDCRSTGKMHLFPRVDMDNELIVFDSRGRASHTPFYLQVREVALDLRARLVVLDVAVDLFGGDEIKRREVRAFARLLNGLARKINGAVVLTSHLSVAGIRSEGGHSASTDWSNAFRSRAYLGRPKDDDAEATDTTKRLLTRKKANFASIGETLKLHWSRGLILPDEYIAGPFRRTADDVFLELLDAVTREGQRVSQKVNAGNYAPSLFVRRASDQRDGFQRRDFERAMQTLFQARKIKVVTYGPRSAGTEMLARNDGAAG